MHTYTSFGIQLTCKQSKTHRPWRLLGPSNVLQQIQPMQEHCWRNIFSTYMYPHPPKARGTRLAQCKKYAATHSTEGLYEIQRTTNTPHVWRFFEERAITPSGVEYSWRWEIGILSACSVRGKSTTNSSGQSTCEFRLQCNFEKQIFNTIRTDHITKPHVQCYFVLLRILLCRGALPPNVFLAIATSQTIDRNFKTSSYLRSPKLTLVSLRILYQ